MSIGLIGTKIGMTREFLKSGQSVPVTVIKVEKGRVLDVITKDKRGYSAVKVGFFKLKNSKLTKQMKGYFYKNTILQKGFNLGEKIWYLKSIVNKNFIVVGSDIPDVNIQNLNYAFKLLKKSDMVIGPSFDNGFWLIGFSKRKAINYPFKNIRWGTKHVLSDLERNTKKYNLKISFCEKLRDIDIIDDYCDYMNKV